MGNFFIGGLIGWLIVDPLTGAMWTLSPTTVNANLAKQAWAPPRGDAILVVSLERQPLPTPSQ